MTDWYEATLESVATFRKGISYKSEDYCAEGSGHPFITIKCFIKGGGYEPSGLKYFDGYFTETDRVFEGDILFAVTDLTRAGDIVGSPLRVPSFGNGCFVLASMDCMKIIPIEELCNQNFLYHRMMLADIRRQMVAYSAGSTVLHLDTKKVPGIVINIPRQVNEQKYIASILDTIDRAIAHTEALIEKYHQIKAGLMHDLFTRGIGADGKLRPTREEAPELYQESAIGWIPREWNCKQIKHYVESAQYGISTSLSDEEVGIPVLRMNNIQGNSFDISDVKYTSNPDAYSLTLKEGDVLYNRTNSMEYVGKTAIWRGELAECSFASYLVRINLYEDMLLPDFFSYWMSQVSSQNALRRYATPGVQQVNINPTNLQKILIPCPRELEEQRKIVARIDSIEIKIQAEKIALDKLYKEKSGLMHDLLTGKVPVKVDPDEVDHLSNQPYRLS